MEGELLSGECRSPLSLTLSSTFKTPSSPENMLQHCQNFFACAVVSEEDHLKFLQHCVLTITMQDN